MATDLFEQLRQSSSGVRDTGDSTSSAGGGSSAVGPNPEQDYRVMLRSAQTATDFIVFVATPDLVETRNVNYKTVEPIHAPGALYAYATTSARTFQLSSVKLISRSQAEADANLVRLWKLRAWCMPDFGGLSVDQLGYDQGSASSAGLGGESLGVSNFVSNTTDAVVTDITKNTGASVQGIGYKPAVESATRAFAAAVKSSVDPISGAIQTTTDAISTVNKAIPGTLRSASNATSLGSLMGGVTAGGGGNRTRDNSATSQLGGSGTGSQLGAPPQVLLLSAYSRESNIGVYANQRANKTAEHINRVPVVIQNLTIPYPSDVDYIDTSSGVPFPTLMSVDITLLETHAPAEYETFSLERFKQGILAEF